MSRTDHKSSKSTNRPRRRLASGMEPLETRHLLAASLMDGNLTIDSPGTGSKIEVFQTDDVILVREDGNVIGSFQPSLVRHIQFAGSARDDYFANHTYIPSRIEGNSGDDTLVGGQGADLIFGGDGDDHLFGNGGLDHLYGQAGHDFIDGGDSQYHIRAAADGNEIFATIEQLVGNLFSLWQHQTLSGGTGDDVLVSESDEDTLNGDQGSDLMYSKVRQPWSFDFSRPFLPWPRAVGDDLHARAGSNDLYLRQRTTDLLDIVGPEGILTLKTSTSWHIGSSETRAEGEISIVDQDLGDIPISFSGISIRANVSAMHGFMHTSDSTLTHQLTDGTIHMDLPSVPNALLDFASRAGFDLPASGSGMRFSIQSGATIKQTRDQLPLILGRPYLIAEFNSASNFEIGGVSGSIGRLNDSAAMVFQPGDETVLVEFPVDSNVQVLAGYSGKGRLPFDPEAAPEQYRHNVSGHLFGAVDGLEIKATGMVVDGSVVVDLDANDDGHQQSPVNLLERLMSGDALESLSDVIVAANGDLTFNQGLEQWVRIDGLPLSVNLPLAEGSAIFDGTEQALYFRAETTSPFQGTVLKDLPYLNSTGGFVDGSIRELSTSSIPRVNIRGEFTRRPFSGQFHLTNEQLSIRGGFEFYTIDLPLTATVHFNDQSVDLTGTFTADLGAAVAGLSASGSVTASAQLQDAAFELTLGLSLHGPGISHTNTIRTNFDGLEYQTLNLLANVPNLGSALFHIVTTGAVEYANPIHLASLGSHLADKAWTEISGIASGRFVARLTSAGTYEALIAPSSVSDVASWLRGEAGENLKKGLYFSESAGKVAWAQTLGGAEKAVRTLADAGSEVWHSVSSIF